MMWIVQNVLLGVLYMVGIPVLGGIGVAGVYWLNGQKHKINFRGWKSHDQSPHT